MRFAVDASLGKLGRLLRSAGFDTLCQHECRQGRFWDRIEPERVILTRTQAIQRRFSGRSLVFIKNNDPLRQLQQVVTEQGILKEDIHPFSRCIVCNAAIVKVDKRSVWGRVPAYVWHHYPAFNECRCCHRIFWAGSHHDRVCRKFETIFQNEERQSHA
ncbi:Mut7-C RNAse domain-containing protein [Desulfosarcina cetonica]|uniref:Mut7-C RNAse domain-containing protein n=1 Tax=Desulfosarcina cetonica TaxID=90730 RepID=UPI0006D13BDB